MLGYFVLCGLGKLPFTVPQSPLVRNEEGTVWITVSGCVKDGGRELPVLTDAGN